MSLWTRLLNTMSATPAKRSAAVSAFVDDVFAFDFTESDDLREWRSHPQLKGVPDLVNSGQLDEAESFLRSAERELGDFDFVHLWLAKVYEARGEPSRAREAYAHGIQRSKCKHDLCGSRAQFELRHGDYLAAVCWWTRSTLLQASLGISGTDQASFAYLSVVAQLCRLRLEASRLQILSAIGPFGGVTFRPEKMRELSDRFPNQHAREISATIQELVERLPNGREPSAA